MFILASSPFLWVLRGRAAQKGCPTPAGRHWSDWPCGRWGLSTGSPESWVDHPAHRHPAHRPSPCSSWSHLRHPRPLLRPHSPPLLPHSPPLLLGLLLQPQFLLPLPTKLQWWLCHSAAHKSVREHWLIIIVFPLTPASCCCLRCKVVSRHFHVSKTLLFKLIILQPQHPLSQTAQSGSTKQMSEEQLFVVNTRPFRQKWFTI